MKAEFYPSHITLNRANEGRVDLTFWEEHNSWVTIYLSNSDVKQIEEGLKEIFDEKHIINYPLNIEFKRG